MTADVARGGEQPTVAVVVPCYNHAHFLAGALDSVAAQTRTPDEVIVIDDGSHDNPSEIARQFPGVRVIRQENRGLSAARNAGMLASTSDYVLFLDADDVLLPEALEANLDMALRDPEVGMVYGCHLRVDALLRPLGPPSYIPVPRDAYREMLRQNPVNAPAAALYHRARLVEAGGFEVDVRRCEDYGSYLAMARRHPVACHSTVVALYRQHDANMSIDPKAMLQGALTVLDRNRPDPRDAGLMRAWREGRFLWTMLFMRAAWRGHPSLSFGARWRLRLGMAARNPAVGVLAAGWHVVDEVLPEHLRLRLRRMVGRAAPAPELEAPSASAAATPVPDVDRGGAPS